MKKIYIIISAFITLIALFTRFVGLDKSPPHLSNDEISIAYDAYSVSKTLRDEHNQFMPLSFKSHGTYKAPLTTYITSFSIRLLGNSDFSARIPSSILGCLTIIFLGLLTFQLTKNINLAFIASAILTITPWHIFTSRMLLETNIALFFLIVALFSHFYAVEKNKGWLQILSFVFFALSMYTYHTEWGLTPLIIGSIFLLYRKRLITNKFYKFGVVLFLLLTFPLFLNYQKNIKTTARANTEILFTQGSLKSQLEKYPSPFRKGQIILIRIFEGYSSYIEPGRLFFESPNLLPSPEPYQVGLFLAPFFPCFVIGLFKVKKYFGKNNNFIYLWLLISPLTPAMTVGGAEVVRNLPFVAPVTIVIAVGLTELYVWGCKKRVVLVFYIFLILLSFFYFYALCWHFFPKESGENFQYGYKQIAEFVKPRYQNYNKIIIDPKFGEAYFFDGVPHLYIPFYTELDPRFLQARKENDPCGNCFAKYEIRGIDWEKEKIKEKTLYIVPFSNKAPDESGDKLRIDSEIKLPNLKPAFVIYEKY